MQFRHVQCLIGVDVAEPGDERLIEQQRFELALFLLECVVKPGRRKFLAKRFRPEPAQHLRRIRRQPDAPKLARVIKYQRLISRQSYYKPVVFGWPDCTIAQQKIATHTQMDEETVILELDVEELGAAAHIKYLLALDGFLEFLRRRSRQRPIPTQVGPENLFTDQRGFQLTRKCFDFR